LDYRVQAPPGTPIEKKVEVVRRMPSKLPWLAVIIVVAAVGLGWLLWPTAVPGWGCLTSSTGAVPGTITALGLLPGPHGDYGIENIFIMIHGAYSLDDDPASWQQDTHYYQVITASGQTVNIPYENLFDIVVVVKIRGDNVAYLTFENVYTSIAIWGAFTDQENSLASDSDWDISGWHENSVPLGSVGKQYPSAYLRFYYRLDNNGQGYKLAAGASIEFQENIYTWK